MLGVIVSFFILCIIVSLLYWILSLFAPAPILRIALVVAIVIIALWLVFMLLPYASVHLVH